MPELPDLTLYVEALQRLTVGDRLVGIRLADPFILRTATPPLSELQGHTLREVRRLGKRLVLGFDDGLFLLIHLMIAGRLHWREIVGRGARGERVVQLSGKTTLAAFDFRHGTLLLTENSTQRRAALHVVRGAPALEPFDAAGVDPLNADGEAFRSALTRERHTLKRALTDPRLFSGIGNAYSDEILHRARLSPVKLTSQLDATDIEALHHATREVLTQWIERLRQETRSNFPEKVTAFRDGMVVHGRYGQPCLVCGTRVQRIVYAENETNYCPTCQTGGKLLADRALSRLLRSDWPKTPEELEQRKGKTDVKR
jgi:formamidopyrimidine-DNA glycosylase